MRFENDSLDNKIIKQEMLSFVPLCTHENTNECLFIGDYGFTKDTDKLAKNISSIKLLDKHDKFDSEKFDIIISSDESIDLQEIFRILKKDGIFCLKASSNIKKQLLELGAYYRIVMPYHNMELIFASNKYHPTADLILDKSDFMENAEYYNSDIHLASFALHEKIKKEMRGIIKN